MMNSPLQKTDFSSFVQDAQSLLSRCIEVMRSKSHDYTEGQDAFVNFKTAASIAGISPEQTLLTLLGMKLSRLTQLVGKGKKAHHESTEDTMLDVINYLLLLRGMLKEQNVSESSQPLASYTDAAPNLLQQ